MNIPQCKRKVLFEKIGFKGYENLLRSTLKMSDFKNNRHIFGKKGLILERATVRMPFF